MISLENCGETARNAASKETEGEQPLFACLHDDEHRDSDGRNFHETS
jgi:hypothetical protein